MKMYLHIEYNDGSNPFVLYTDSINKIKKELEHQLSPWRNLFIIKSFNINGNVHYINITEERIK